MAQDKEDVELRREFMRAKIAAVRAEEARHLGHAAHEAAMAESSRLDNELTTFAINKRAREERDELATNKHHFVYVFDEVVSDRSVSICMEQLTKWARVNPDCAIEIVFNSPGGSITDGFALFDYIQMLRHSGHHITTTALGMAASMAGVLLQAGDHRVMGEQAVVLLHEASFGAIGKTGVVEDTLELVKKLQKRIVHIFATRTVMKAAYIEKKWKRKDWWLTSDECLKLGIVDEVRMMPGDILKTTEKAGK